MPVDSASSGSLAADARATGRSPAATGPAGALLEAHVGAQFLLPVLLRGEARGLPGVLVARVQFQRSALGFPLDDVIVTGRDQSGNTATIEIQVKRSIEFTQGDTNFRGIVDMACRAAAKPEFDTTRYEVAVASGRSARIDRHARAVLQWARAYQAHAEFFRRLEQSGAAHQSMRDFVGAFRSHMRAAGAVDDPASVWGLLRRFQVLTFDAEDVGSSDAVLARERCVALLSPEDSGRAGDLWDALGQVALEVDSAGGDLDATSLLHRLTSERGFRFAGDRRLLRARNRVAESATSALATISTRVHGVNLPRDDQIEAALVALERGRYLEIRGQAGAGKSGVLKTMAECLEVESRVIVITPNRVAPGGWAAWQSQLGCDATAREFLVDLAGDGGATLFIDGIDRFDNPAERATVVDLIRTASEIQGFRVVATARFDFDADAAAWLPEDAIQRLGRAPPLAIEALTETEAEQLRSEDPALAALLRPGHPAEKLVRNLYRLERLARAGGTDGDSPFSEAQMAYQWWQSGDSQQAPGRLERRRVLHDFALQLLTGSALLDISSHAAAPIEELVTTGSLRSIRTDRAEFTHDVLRDWAIASVLFDEPHRVAALPFSLLAPVHLARGIEMLAQLLLERTQDCEAWLQLLGQVSGQGAHGSWRRVVLLALTRSERSLDVLQRCDKALLGQDGALLVELVKAAVTVDSRPASDFWSAHGVDVSKIPPNYVMPNGPSWLNLVVWTLVIVERLPHAAIPTLVDFYGRWCAALNGQDAVSPELVKHLHRWLVKVEKHALKPTLRRFAAAVEHEEEGIPLSTTDEANLRQTFLMWCTLQPELADAYLRSVAGHRNNHSVFRQIVGFVGGAPRAAPSALVDLFLSALRAADKDDRSTVTRDVYGYWNTEYFPASPARAPFYELLVNHPEEGLRLVRGVVDYAVARRSGGQAPVAQDGVVLSLPEGERTVPWVRTYRWSRESGSDVVTSALMALEAWGHMRVERGDPIEAVVADLLGPPGACAAFLLVAIDILLSSWPASRGALWPFAANAELLALDRNRYRKDSLSTRDQVAWVRPEPLSLMSLADLRRRPSRQFPMDAFLYEYGRDGPDEVRSAMRSFLSSQKAKLGPPDDQSQAMADPRFAAMSAFNRLDPANHVQSEGAWVYVEPPDEAALLQRLQDAAALGSDEVNTYLRLVHALDSGPAQPALLQKALAWLRDSQGAEKIDDVDFERARWILAVLILRDGELELRETCAKWCREELQEAALKESGRTGHVPQIPYNPASIAMVGLIAAHRHGDASDLATLLQLAVQDRSGLASVLEAELKAGRGLDGGLARAFVRLGITSEIYGVRRGVPLTGDDWRERQSEVDAARVEAERNLRDNAVRAEYEWLSGRGPEPALPELPDPEPPRPRHRSGQDRRRQREDRVFALDAEGASRWLRIAGALWADSDSSRLRALLKHAWPWTAAANGAGAGRDVEPTERAMQWNAAFFSASVDAAVSSDAKDFEQLVLSPLSKLADEALSDSIEAALHRLDALWIGEGKVTDAEAFEVRQRVSELLCADRAWTWLVKRDPSHGVAMHLGGAIAAVFFGQYDFLARGPRCYLTPAGVYRSDPFLPRLSKLAKDAAGSTFVAFAFLNLLEVAPRMSALGVLAEVTAGWWGSQSSNPAFWLEFGIGSRVCRWAQMALASESALTEGDSGRLIAIADILLRCGITEAKQLEEKVLALPNKLA